MPPFLLQHELAMVVLSLSIPIIMDSGIVKTQLSVSRWKAVAQSMNNLECPQKVKEQLATLSRPNEQSMMGFRLLMAQVPVVKLQSYVPALVAAFRGGDVMHIMPLLQYSLLEAMLSGGCKHQWFYHRQPTYAVHLKMLGTTSRWAKKIDAQEPDVDKWIRERLVLFEPAMNQQLFYYVLSFVICEHWFPDQSQPSFMPMVGSLSR